MFDARTKMQRILGEISPEIDFVFETFFFYNDFMWRGEWSDYHQICWIKVKETNVVSYEMKVKRGYRSNKKSLNSVWKDFAHVTVLFHKSRYSNKMHKVNTKETLSIPLFLCAIVCLHAIEIQWCCYFAKINLAIVVIVFIWKRYVNMFVSGCHISKCNMHKWGTNMVIFKCLAIIQAQKKKYFCPKSNW